MNSIQINRQTAFNNETLNKMLEQYKKYLFEDYLPFINEYLYDQEHGGYFWNTSYHGEQRSSNKRTWYDARGTWVYSYLYKVLDSNPLYLERAKQTLKLLYRAKDTQAHFWPWSYDREGNDLKEREGDIYGNLFVAEALAAYSDASGEQDAWLEAKNILQEAFALYQTKEYRYLLEYSPTKDYPEAEEILGHYMIVLHLCTTLLRLQDDAELEEISDYCLEALLQKHYDAELNLMPELRSKTGSALGENLDQFVYIGHAIETLWMIMDEAKRRQDQELFDLAASRFKFHVEVAKDDLFGGFFHCLDHAKENRFLLDKVLWAQEEVMVGCLLLMEERADAWAYDTFQNTLQYLQQHFILDHLRYRPWKINGNRQMNRQEEGTRIENYHHPRHLMYGILTFQQLINRNTLNLNSYEK